MTTELFLGRLPILTVAGVIALVLSAALIVLLRPWLERYVLARPNARSSHQQPTPQGGGIAVIAATLAVAWCAVVFAPALTTDPRTAFMAASAAALLLAIVGAVDDISTLPATPRLLLQSLAVGAVIAAVPSDWQLLPLTPWWLERLLLLVAGVWFVNLVNFMDGIDWMTVTETVPVTGAIVLLGLLDFIEMLPAIVAATLLGAMLGFAPFNRPPARLFLGDVGSLPTGVLLGWLLLELARRGYLAAAVILPLYYLCDATTTLLGRMLRGERFWQAHREHFYQRAAAHGFTVSEIVSRIFVLNLVLVAAALVTIAARSLAVSLITVTGCLALVIWLLASFARGKQEKRQPSGRTGDA